MTNLSMLSTAPPPQEKEPQMNNVEPNNVAGNANTISNTNKLHQYIIRVGHFYALLLALHNW